jgi:hypothetical protein
MKPKFGRRLNAMKHGNESFLIKDEELIDAPLFPEELFREENGLHGVFPRDVKLKSVEQVPKPTRKFCRLFPKGDQSKMQGKDLIALGLSMEKERREDANNANNLDSNIPAGYTYLAQFIDHDITLDRDTKLTEDGQVEPCDIENFRTPSLDLDSLYLGGPNENPELYNPDKRTFKIGKNTNSSVTENSNLLQRSLNALGRVINNLIKRESTDSNSVDLNNDLPRIGGRDKNQWDAIIGDSRNDENLVVAQTTLAFLKFHNALAADPNKSFDDLRREVTRHYQAIVLHDFLPQMLDQDVLNDVLQNGRKLYTDDKKDCMPIEFSVAAFRMGHSMVRPSYEWNKYHNSTQTVKEATLNQLFEFSGGSGSTGEGDLPFQDNKTLPSDWIIDWRRFYDFSKVGGEKHQQLNHTRKLDTNMAFSLQSLPQFANMKVPNEFLSLATRDLLRGRVVSLPSGQEVAEKLVEEKLLNTEDILTQQDICNAVGEFQAEILKKYGLDKATPLWYYILREAMVRANGNHLGKVGSRIIAETFVGLIQNSSINVTSEQPDLRFSMPELLKTIPNGINPLGD